MKNKLVGIVLSISLLLVSCSGEGDNSADIDVAEIDWNSEQVTEVARGDVEEIVLVEGYTAPKVWQMKFEEEGTFDEYLVHMGDEVKKGQVLAVMDDTGTKEKIEQYQEQLAALTAEYEYQTTYSEMTIAAYEEEMKGYYAKLEDKRSPLSPEEYTAVCRELGIRDVAKQREELKKSHLQESYELESSYIRQQIQKEKNRLSRMSIKAPCDGTVIATLNVDANSFVSKRDYYVAVAQKDVYYVRCEYLTQMYLESMEKISGFRNGTEFELSFVEMDEAVNQEMKNNGETVFTHFEIQSPEGLQYGELMLVKLVRNSRENVLLIPNIAINRNETGRYVTKQTPEGKENVPVVLGITDKVVTEVLSGVEEGDVIYVQKK